MISSFLLLANKFEFKRREVLIILIALIFTLSLAAYVLTLISFSLYMLFNIKQRFAYLSKWVLILMCSYFFFTSWNDGNNVINEQIISRLEYDESNDDIVGNNRVQESFNEYYLDFINTELAWVGIGAKKYNQIDFGPGNAGYKVFLVQYGILGTLLISFFYIFLAAYNKSKLALALLIIYTLAFLQRAYPFWACELIIFITSLPISNRRYSKVIT
jgi:hypothetical protein